METIEENDISRNFDLIDIQWQISNFCFETVKENFKIYTPEILVEGICATRWKITLNTKKKVNEEYYFSIILERLECENKDESDDVVVSFKVWLTDWKGEEYSVRRHSGKYKSNHLNEIMLESKNYFRDKIKPLIYTDGILLIRCLLLVKRETKTENEHKPTLLGLRSLSDDLLNFFKNGIKYDIAVKLKDKNVYAHKAILCPRSKAIADSVGCEDGDSVCDLSSYDFIDYETAHNLFSYVYSGDISHISRNASIYMYESALLLKIPGIKEYFNPRSLNIHSEIDVKRYTFSWVIRECAQITEDYILSPIFVADNMNTTWRLRLYMKGVDHADNYLSVFADVVEGEKPDNCCFGFTMVDDSGNLWSERRNMLKDPIDVFGFENFISKDYFKFKLEKLDLDIVHVVFRIDIYTNTFSNYEEYDLYEENFNVNHFYLILSKDLTTTLEQGAYSNFSLESEGIRYKVHKSIIAARSPVLKSFLLSRSDESSFTVNMNSNILQTALQYIYSGVCNNLVEHEPFDLYKAAEYLSLKHLKEECTRFLEEHYLRTESVFDVLAFSHEQQNEDLKSSALNFISLNRSTVFLERGWENLVHKYPFLRAEVEVYINRNSV